MHLAAFISALLFRAALAFPARNDLHPRDPSSAIALLSAYTDDNCDWPPFGDFVVDFEPSGEGQCVGNGTVAKGVYLEKLADGCVVNAFTFANCTGEMYQLDQEGCWVDFTVDNTDVGVQGVSVTCIDSTASASSSTIPTATPLMIK